MSVRPKVNDQLDRPEKKQKNFRGSSFIGLNNYNYCKFVSTVALLLLLSLGIPLSAEDNKEASSNKIIGQWHFDEGEGEIAKDSSGTGADLKLSGATWAEGKKGKCLAFDGKGSCAYTAKIYQCFELTGNEFTISCWVKPEYEYPKPMFIISNSLSAHRGPGYRLCFSYGALNFGSGEGWGKNKKYWSVHTPKFKDGKVPEKTIQKGSWYKGVVNNRWYHIAVTYKGGLYKIYVDGKIAGEKQEKAVVPAKHRLVIGNRNPKESKLCYKGLIDEVEILNRAKTGEEIIDDALLVQ
ncbi:MAG: LamG domain-containing protein [Victivallaceae bacterium]